MNCETCRKPYGVEPLLQVEGKTICNTCFRTYYGCPGCGQPISGAYVPDKATGKKWHPPCHQRAFPPLKGCDECKRPFNPTEPIYEVLGRQLCYSCSQLAVQFVCTGCGQIIRDAYIPVDDSKYHSACFERIKHTLFCNNCHVPFGNKPYAEIDGKNLCDNCWQKIYSCAKCGGRLTDAVVESDGMKYHPQCATIPLCGGCNQPIVAGEYILLDGRKWHTGCKHIYHQRLTMGRLTGSSAVGPTRICARCNQPIIGEYVVINNKDHHPECFSTTQRHHQLRQIGRAHV